MKKAALALLCAFMLILQGCGPLIITQAGAATPPSTAAALPFSAAQPNTDQSPSASAAITQTATTSTKGVEPIVQLIGSDVYLVHCDTPVTLRSTPSPTAKAVGSLADGQQVRVTGYEGAFAHVVDSSGRTGYALCGYLVSTVQDPALTGFDVVKPVQAYTYDRMMKDLQQLADEYPGKLHLGSVGKTLEGRDIPVVTVGDPNASKQVIICASIHARENMTTMLVMTQLEYCLKNGAAPFSDSTVGQTLSGVCLRVLPMVNPDGVTISQTAMMTDSLLKIYNQERKSESPVLTPVQYLQQWKANAAGVDLNRNFPTGWKKLASAKEPSSSRFKGSSPGDQPEVRALMDYTKRFSFAATVSYHATGGCLYWQYGSNKTVNSRSKSLALAVRSVTMYTLKGSEGLDAGGFKDWAMDALHIPSITIEVGSRDCPLPLDEFSTVWSRNRDVLAAVCNWVMKSQ